MKRILISVRRRSLWLCLAVVAAVGWSCTKDENFFENNNLQTQGAIAQARSFYERTAVPLTKSIGGQSIAVKPLPGEMTPLWDKAAATVLADGTTAWVDVPIEAKVVYTAVRNGFHAHQAEESCGHDHSPVQAVQKLTVHTAADGTKQSLIATIVPEPDCTAELNGFSSAEGLDGFSGFVSWHDLTGKLLRVAGYENGVQTRSAEATGDNEKEILEIVDETVLYPITNFPATKTDGYCNLCNDNCPEPNRMTYHCNLCGKYDPPIAYTDIDHESKCTCRPRCSKCGQKIPEGKDACPSCSNTSVTDPFCKYCGALNCRIDHAIYPDQPIVPPPYVVQQEMLMNVLRYSVNQSQFSDIINGTYSTDLYYQNKGEEYIHGLFVDTDNTSQAKAHDQMRNYFILYAQAFVAHDTYYALGKALHPIIDTYVMLQTRIDMLEYYTYQTKRNIVDGSNIIPFTVSPGPCANAIQFVYNELMKQEATVTAEAIGNIFDRWLQLTGGGY